MAKEVAGSGEAGGVERFTKGPWRAEDVADEDSAAAPEEACANAHLIASAPALYEALALFDKYSLVIESAVRNIDPGHRMSVVHAIRTARAALSLARGETPATVSSADCSAPQEDGASPNPPSQVEG